MTDPFQVTFTSPSSTNGTAAVGVAAAAMAERGVPMISLGDVASVRLYEVLYGYERDCGRNVLVMVRRYHDTIEDAVEDALVGADVAVFGEVIEPGVMWHDGGPSGDLHEAMLTGVPGEMVQWQVDIGSHEYTKFVTRGLRRLSEEEMAALVGVDYTYPDGGTPMRPKIRRALGEKVFGEVHDCEVCSWA